MKRIYGQQLQLFEVKEIKVTKKKPSLNPVDSIIRLMSSEYEYFQKLGVRKFKQLTQGAPLR